MEIDELEAMYEGYVTGRKMRKDMFRSIIDAIERIDALLNRAAPPVALSEALWTSAEDNPGIVKTSIPVVIKAIGNGAHSKPRGRPPKPKQPPIDKHEPPDAA